MVTDIGGLNDRSFNQSAYEGLKRAESELGAEIRAVTSKSNADYVPNLTTLARQKYDLVIAVGFLMAEATEKVAASSPTSNFAIIDSSAGGDEVEAEERSRASCSRRTRPATSSATWPACTRRTRAATR